MEIVGEWFPCADGATRPVVYARVFGTGGTKIDVYFLVDSGADRTVFSAALADQLQLPVSQPTDGTALVGIGGESGYVLLSTVIEYTRDDGGPVRIRGEFAAFTDPRAADLSILGRDILNNFDVIISWPRKEFLLLAPNHHYRVERS